MQWLKNCGKASGALMRESGAKLRADGAGMPIFAISAHSGLLLIKTYPSCLEKIAKISFEYPALNPRIVQNRHQRMNRLACRNATGMYPMTCHALKPLGCLKK